MLLALVFLDINRFHCYPSTSIYICLLSLHDALPISPRSRCCCCGAAPIEEDPMRHATLAPSFLALLIGLTQAPAAEEDRKSTRLNSSHRCISYAVFCLKKKTATLTALITADLADIFT